MLNAHDEKWMQRAIELAKHAALIGEVPVGAIIVKDNQLIGAGFNQPIKRCDPSAHAEILALRHAAENVGNYRLPDSTLYVTLEPCMMCAGAIVHARIKRLVFGASDSRTGVIQSVASFLGQPFLNHQVNYVGGVHADQCSEIMSEFFRARR
ncbi:MAG: Cytidine/deoxycytidylate deaminase family protein [uncultured bacterium]|nr:MAG: Cytidine/deoxycytidylate deaminase family protein [uncultured bacterium]